MFVGHLKTISFHQCPMSVAPYGNILDPQPLSFLNSFSYDFLVTERYNQIHTVTLITYCGHWLLSTHIHSVVSIKHVMTGFICILTCFFLYQYDLFFHFSVKYVSNGWGIEFLWFTTSIWAFRAIVGSFTFTTIFNKEFSNSSTTGTTLKLLVINCISYLIITDH